MTKRCCDCKGGGYLCGCLILHTYDEWKDLGFIVMKGQKSKTKQASTGKALFSHDQVKATITYAWCGDSDGSAEEEEMEAYDRAEGWYDWDNIGDR